MDGDRKDIQCGRKVNKKEVGSSLPCRYYIVNVSASRLPRFNLVTGERDRATLSDLRCGVSSDPNLFNEANRRASWSAGMFR